MRLKEILRSENQLSMSWLTIPGQDPSNNITVEEHKEEIKTILAKHFGNNKKFSSFKINSLEVNPW